MSVRDVLGLSSPLPSPVGLSRGTSYDWFGLQRTQSATSSAFGNLALTSDMLPYPESQSVSQQMDVLASVPPVLQLALPPAPVPVVVPLAQPNGLELTQLGADQSAQELKVKEEPLVEESRPRRNCVKRRKPSPPPSDDDSVGGEVLTKRERNRLAAAKSREKRKIYVTKLEASNERLKTKIDELSKQLIKSQKKVVDLTGRVAVLNQELQNQKALQPPF